jgi:transposase-like protein
MLPCPRCTASHVKKDGRVGETQCFHCRNCRRTFIMRTGTSFASHHWPQEVIVTAVRWYLRFR